jgi:MFS family permease
MKHEASGTSTFAPFRHRIFFAIWVANLFSNFGSLIQGVGASWLMTSLAPSADMVSLVQASTSLPIMLLSLAAGALADIRDRRRVMLAAQGWMLAVSASLAALAHWGSLTPWALLTFTFMIGCGAALNGPAWQSSVGEQVPRQDLPGAIALNSLGFNLARASGPAIGGLVVASFGPESAFLLNAISYVGLIVVLLRWQRPVQASSLAPEGLLPAMGAGLRYAWLSPRIGLVLVRALLFGLLAAAVWSLLPLVARDVLAGGPLVYGLLLGAFGSGAVLGALTSARLRHTSSNERIVGLSSLVFGLATVGTASSASLPLTMLALVLAGACWVLALSTFNILVQLASPRWVVGRTMSVYQMATFGGLAIGSWTWGQVAHVLGLPVALATAGGMLAASAALGLWLHLPDQEALDVEPSGAWGDPRLALPVPPRAGPVVTVLEYFVPSPRHTSFLAAMGALRRIRRRDGARAWSLVQDMAEPDRWIERFENPTWIEHLRHHQRVTNADRAIEARVHALVAEGTRPVVRHLLEHQVGVSARPWAVAASARTAATDPNVPSGIALPEPPHVAPGEVPGR